MKKMLSLKPEDLRVETFAAEKTAPGLVVMTTRWPKDCAETLPRFC
jgi:hypothetical protein